MNNEKTINAKELAAELMKAVLPKIEDLQKQIKALDKRITILDGKLQSISSVIINKRKHQKS